MRSQEHHLQAVISAAQTGGKIASLYIPTPETVQSKLEYERLYPKRFQQPATYIRFSSTVEDCIGCPYCMNTDDDAFLKAMNAKKPKTAQCSEDQFEEVMNFFEETSAAKQPFAAVDNPPVLPFEEMESAYDETIEEYSRRFAKDIYEHWKAQRLKRGNTPLMPTLKFERNVETDDSDPYVCFRRREVRQARKTRGRDAQVAEKLKKLRHELEQARHLLHLVKQREYMRRDQLQLDRSIFEQRQKVKDMKRNLGIKGDDEDLINQKVRRSPGMAPLLISILTCYSRRPNLSPSSKTMHCNGVCPAQVSKRPWLARMGESATQRSYISKIPRRRPPMIFKNTSTTAPRSIGDGTGAGTTKPGGPSLRHSKTSPDLLFVPQLLRLYPPRLLPSHLEPLTTLRTWYNAIREKMNGL